MRLTGLRAATTYRIRITVDVGAGFQPHTPTVTVRTPAAGRPPVGAWFTLGNALTGAAELYGSRRADGTPLVLQPPAGNAAQQWRLEAVPGGGYLLRSRVSGKCVAPLAGVVAPGTPVVQRPCAAADPTQRWAPMPNADGFALATAAGGLTLGLGRSRFGEQRLLVLQRPGQARYQNWVALPA